MSSDICKSSWRHSLYHLDTLLSYISHDGQELERFLLQGIGMQAASKARNTRASEQEYFARSPNSE